MIRAYHCAAVTLNLCRAFTTGGYADLHQVHAWNQDFVGRSPAGQRYERLAGEIDQALAFMRACGADPDQLRSVELYSSHEALMLDYEQALTRIDSRTGRRYGTSGALAVGRRADQGAGRRARRVRPRHLQPGRGEARPGHLPGRGAGADRRAEPGQPAGPAHADHAGSARRGSARSCPPWSARSPPAARRWRGSATRCTATRSRRPAATRPAGSTTCWTSWPGSSRCTAAWAPIPAASTSSSPATTSPSASAAATRSARTTCTSATRPRATPG